MIADCGEAPVGGPEWTLWREQYVKARADLGASDLENEFDRSPDLAQPTGAASGK